MSGILYLERNEIDTSKWDRCIVNASNGLIYARSFYLDAVAVNWGALILNDYEAVMPLAWNRKYSISYCYQPFFTSHLGIFAQNLTPGLVTEFVKLIPSKFKLAEIDLNEWNEFPTAAFKTGNSKFQFSHRVNQFITLASYEAVLNNYHRLANRMLNKANNENVKIESSTDPNTVIRFYQKNYAQRHQAINAASYERLAQASNDAFMLGLCQLLEAKIDGETVAVYLVFADDKFVYSVLGGSNDKGRETGAFYALTDHAIKNNCGNGRIFRFEGSDIEGIQSFNAQFGAEKKFYIHLKYNNLPTLIRWLK